MLPFSNKEDLLLQNCTLLFQESYWFSLLSCIFPTSSRSACVFPLWWDHHLSQGHLATFRTEGRLNLLLFCPSLTFYTGLLNVICLFLACWQQKHRFSELHSVHYNSLNGKGRITVTNIVQILISRAAIQDFPFKFLQEGRFILFNLLC